MNTKRIKISKGLFLFNGVTTILIGMLHTYAHFKELVTPEVNSLLDKALVVMGADSNIWSLWQGMSLMMGMQMVAMGLISVLIIWNLKPGVFPPTNISLVIILMLIFVVYCGINFFGPGQLYGGIAGIIIQSVSILLSKVKN